MMDDSMLLLAQRVGEALLAQNASITTVESCTGGGVAYALTAIAGSSAWFDGGRVTYSNTSKLDLICAAVLDAHGAVSEPVVAALTQGQLAHCGADYALAISGIAGPTGATPGKPVGTVCFAWQRRGAQPQTQTLHLPGDRAAVRRASIVHALETWLRHYGTPPGA